MPDHPQPNEGLPLAKKEIIDVISMEIADRETLLSKRGVSEWTLKATLVLLVWTIATGVTDNPPSWFGFGIVYCCAWRILVAVERLASDTGPNPIVRPGGKSISLGHLLRDTIRPYALVVDALLVIVPVLFVRSFWAQGYPLLAILILTGAALGLLLLGIGLLFTVVRFPIPNSLPSRGATWLSWLTPAIVGLVYLGCVGICVAALAKVWPSLDKSDVRQGLLCCGLARVVELLFLIRPSLAIPELKDLRRRLAFGRIPIPAAIAEFERIQFGPSSDDHIGAKEIEIAKWLSLTAEQYRAALPLMKDLCSMAEAIRAAENTPQLTAEQAAHFTETDRNAFKALKSVRAMDVDLRQAISTLQARVKLSRLLGLVSSSEERAVWDRFHHEFEKMETDRRPVREMTEKFLVDRHFLELRKSQNPDPSAPPTAKISGAELFTALFKD